jgi:hypothetical protein
VPAARREYQTNEQDALLRQWLRTDPHGYRVEPFA